MCVCVRVSSARLKHPQRLLRYDCTTRETRCSTKGALCRDLASQHTIMMADFDAIYEEQELSEENMEEAHVQMVPDPIVIRGAGNMTV